jgi:hypothetical protein
MLFFSGVVNDKFYSYKLLQLYIIPTLTLMLQNWTEETDTVSPFTPHESKFMACISFLFLEYIQSCNRYNRPFSLTHRSLQWEIMLWSWCQAFSQRVILWEQEIVRQEYWMTTHFTHQTRKNIRDTFSNMWIYITNNILGFPCFVKIILICVRSISFQSSFITHISKTISSPLKEAIFKLSWIKWIQKST